VKVKKTNKKCINIIDIIVNYTGAIIMLIIIILVSLQIFSRYIFKSPPSWPEELSRYSLIWLVMIGAVIGLSNKEHIKIETFVHLLNAKYRKLFYLLSDFVMFFVLFILLIYGYSFASLNINQYSPSMSWMSLFWPFLAIPVGSGLMLIYVIVDFFKKIGILNRGDLKNVDS